MIIDLAGNSLTFGRPDLNRKWTLALNPPKESGEAPAKQCPERGAIVPAGARFCDCGYEFEFEVTFSQRANWKRRAAKKAWAAFRTLEFARSYEELEHVADFMNYKRGWAWHQAQRLGIRKG